MFAFPNAVIREQTLALVIQNLFQDRISFFKVVVIYVPKLTVIVFPRRPLYP